MSNTITSQVVESKSKAGKAIKIDDIWYSVFHATDLDHVSIGDTVTFSYKIKGTFHNISGKVTVDKKGEGPTVTVTDRSAPPPAQFPVGVTVRERSICRQTALKAAAEVFKCSLPDPGAPLNTIAAVEDILTMARAFEAYVTGDDIKAELAALEKNIISEAAD